jgi:hypothetical protein
MNGSMRITSHIIVFAATASLTMLPLKAQLAFRFTTTVGNGSFTLNTNHLVYGGDNGSAARYTDVLDTFTFAGVVYTNLEFSVYNNSFIVGNKDGFQILVDRFSQSSSDARLEIDVSGNNSVASGVSVADLVRVLSGYTALQSNSPFNTTALYNNPNPPHQQMVGTVTSFELITTPLMSGASVHGNAFGFDITGGTGSTAVVEICTIIGTNQTWSPIQTNLMTNGSWFFTDPTWTNSAERFYRARVQ